MEWGGGERTLSRKRKKNNNNVGSSDLLGRKGGVWNGVMTVNHNRYTTFVAPTDPVVFNHYSIWQNDWQASCFMLCASIPLRKS